MKTKRELKNQLCGLFKIHPVASGALRLLCLAAVQVNMTTIGQVFVASTSGTIAEYTTSGQVINSNLLSRLPVLEGIAVDGDGYLYVAQEGDHTIGKYTTSGAIVKRNLISGLSSPWALTLDGQGKLFVADYGGSIGEYTTSGTVINSALVVGLRHPIGIALDTDGIVYVVEYGMPMDWISRISKYTLSGVPVNPSVFTGMTGLWGITLDDNGHFFVVNNNPPGNIIEFTKSGEVVNSSLFSGGVAPTSIAFDGEGLLYVASDYGGISVYTTSGSGVTGWGTIGHSRGVAVAMPPKSAVVVNGDRTAEFGTPISFAVTSKGTLPLKYRWFFNGTNLISYGTDNSLVLTNADFSMPGTYTVVVSNAFGAVTSAPVMLNVIPVVERRPVPAINLMGEAGTTLNIEFTDALGPLANWLPLDTVNLSEPPQFWFELTEPLPPQRFYRAWQSGTPSVAPSLSLPALVPAITLTGNTRDSLRLDCINAIGPTDAWVTLDTVTLTNTSQLYFDTSSLGQPRRLYRIVPAP